METSELKLKFSQFVRELQNEITDEIFKIDSKCKLIEDKWSRKDHEGNDGGGGITRAFSGEILENAGVNTSEVFGAISPEFADKLQGSGNSLWASGISLILHPRNPKVPTVHANFRFIHQGEKFWFGGGADLTPYYPYFEDFSHFHQTLKESCPNEDVYQQMKKTCDEYFVNHHRNSEMRGIGGIFYDHYFSGNLEADFAMVKKIAKSFIPSYFPIFHKRHLEKYTQQDEDFQLFRRGRYVEFNLLHDRGTLFGLKTKGRVESILISLPARCNFHYRHEFEKNEVQKTMMEQYYPRDWA
jgi:coproporphyrinogen III oxidase